MWKGEIVKLVTFEKLVGCSTGPATTLDRLVACQPSLCASTVVSVILRSPLPQLAFAFRATPSAVAVACACIGANAQSAAAKRRRIHADWAVRPISHPSYVLD